MPTKSLAKIEFTKGPMAAELVKLKRSHKRKMERIDRLKGEVVNRYHDDRIAIIRRYQESP